MRSTAGHVLIGAVDGERPDSFDVLEDDYTSWIRGTAGPMLNLLNTLASQRILAPMRLTGSEAGKTSGFADIDSERRTRREATSVL